jgi:gamma-glutamyl-gamma-aminobutyrate hydrolase PuuD
MFEARGWECVDGVDEASLVQFCGGADVNPALYGEKPLAETHFDVKRDKYEEAIFLMADKKGVPMTGICRGAQFLHVMCGGKLWQDVSLHQNGPHVAELVPEYLKDMYRWAVMRVTSTHHQMMQEGVGELIMTSSLHGMRRSNNLRVTNATSLDVEAVYHKDGNVLCYQPHPEYVVPEFSCQQVYFDLIDKLLFKKEKKK